MAKKVKSRSLAQKAYDSIKKMIISGQLQPGEMVSISSLADRLSISRTPVTLACQKLEYDHFVTVAPKQGIIIKTIGIDDAREIYELRAAIETYAGKLAFYLIDDNDVAVLKKYNDTLRQAMDNADPYTFMVEDTAFHKFLLSKYTNTRWLSIIENLYDRAFLIGLKSCSRPQRMLDSIEEHESMIYALEQRDMPGFVEAIERNIMNGYICITSNYPVFRM